KSHFELMSKNVSKAIRPRSYVRGRRPWRSRRYGCRRRGSGSRSIWSSQDVARRRPRDVRPRSPPGQVQAWQVQARQVWQAQEDVRAQVEVNRGEDTATRMYVLRRQHVDPYNSPSCSLTSHQ
uniref:Uncharacterized protein n=1 Tax=Aegilops tauschii subsp. strangulata TaxID=200361 RepID=A0A453M927_AEGTS